MGDKKEFIQARSELDSPDLIWHQNLNSILLFIKKFIYEKCILKEPS
jgi:hypothetical protein